MSKDLRRSFRRPFYDVQSYFQIQGNLKIIVNHKTIHVKLKLNKDRRTTEERFIMQFKNDKLKKISHFFQDTP